MTGHQLSLAAATAPTFAAASDQLRLTVFNVQNAAPARARAQIAWLAARREADVLVLTEVGTGPGSKALSAALTDHGYDRLLCPEPGPARDYRTVLASRGPDLDALDSGVAALSHRAPCASLAIGSTEVLLLGLYVPSRGPRERRNEDKRAFQTAVAAALPALVEGFEGPVVAAGDLNVVEPGHVPHRAVFGRWEYDFYDSFAGAGLVDAYRHLHPGRVEHSWYGRGGNGYRFDHVFTTGAHRALIQECGYLHRVRHEGLSDHSAMVLTLNCR